MAFLTKINHDFLENNQSVLAAAISVVAVSSSALVLNHYGFFDKLFESPPPPPKKKQGHLEIIRYLVEKSNGPMGQENDDDIIGYRHLQLLSSSQPSSCSTIEEDKEYE